MENMPILCLDFDGVLHSYTTPWEAAYIIPDHPVMLAEEFLEMAIKYFRVCVYSSRSHQEDGILAMRSWMIAHFGTKIVDKIEFPKEKPPAKVTLDDRAITFTGEWPDIDVLLNFVPWNRKRGN